MTFFSYLTSAVRTLPAKGRRNGLKVLTLGVGLSVGLVLAGVVMTILVLVALVSDGYVRHIASANPAKTVKME